MLRFSFGTAMITVPSYLYDEVPNVMKRIEHMVDAVIEIESFAGILSNYACKMCRVSFVLYVYRRSSS